MVTAHRTGQISVNSDKAGYYKHLKFSQHTFFSFKRLCLELRLWYGLSQNSNTVEHTCGGKIAIMVCIGSFNT